MTTSIVSAIQPTGSGAPHLGNFLGVISGLGQYVRETDKVFIADLHATTQVFDPSQMVSSCRTTAAFLMASGIPHSTVFRQSAVRQHAELFLYLTHLSKVGELARMTQFQQKAGGNFVADDSNADSIPMGLLTYPVLMAADILLYRPQKVPAGEDQAQHLELTRKLARALNRLSGTEVFDIPSGVNLCASSGRIMSLSSPENKMSKSDASQNGVVFLSDAPDVAAKKYKTAITDSKFGLRPTGPQSAGGHNLANILSLMTGTSYQDVIARYADKGYGTLKKVLIDAHMEHMEPIRQKAVQFMSCPEYIDGVLHENAILASQAAEQTMQKVRQIFGME